MSTTSIPTTTPAHRFRFGLPTLLGLVTVSAVLLTLIVSPARRQQQAVAAFRNLGGVVYYEGDKPFADIPASRRWLRNWLPDDYVRNVLAVYLTNAQLGDAAFEHLNGLPQLQVLDFASTKITSARLQDIKNLTELRNLYIGGMQLTGKERAELLTALPNCQVTFTDDETEDDAK